LLNSVDLEKMSSDLHDLLFLQGDQFSDLLFVLVQQVVGVLLAAFQLVLADLLLLFELFDFVDHVAAEIAQRNFGILAELFGQLHELLAALFGERRNADADVLAVRRRIEAEIGVADRAFGWADHRLVPNLHGEGVHVEHADVADLLERHLRPISFDLDPVEQRRSGLAGADRGNFVLERLDGFLHARLDFLDNVPCSHGGIWFDSGNRLLGAGFRGSFREAFLEALDAASGIDEHLLAGVEWVATAANIDLDVVSRGAGLEAGAAVRAVDGNFRILWMNL
jgi:hypothetical protein